MQYTQNQTKTSVPQVETADKTGNSIGSFFTRHNIFMMVCCAVMVFGTGFLIATAPAGQTIGQTLLLAAPMLGCVGMHLVMHRFMGKSCHGGSKSEAKND